MKEQVKKEIVLIKDMIVLNPEEQTLLSIARQLINTGTLLGGDIVFSKGSKVTIKVEIE